MKNILIIIFTLTLNIKGFSAQSDQPEIDQESIRQKIHVLCAATRAGENDYIESNTRQNATRKSKFFAMNIHNAKQNIKKMEAIEALSENLSKADDFLGRYVKSFSDMCSDNLQHFILGNSSSFIPGVGPYDERAAKRGINISLNDFASLKLLAETLSFRTIEEIFIPYTTPFSEPILNPSGGSHFSQETESFLESLVSQETTNEDIFIPIFIHLEAYLLDLTSLAPHPQAYLYIYYNRTLDRLAIGQSIPATMFDGSPQEIDFFLGLLAGQKTQIKAYLEEPALKEIGQQQADVLELWNQYKKSGLCPKDWKDLQEKARQERKAKNAKKNAKRKANKAASKAVSAFSDTAFFQQAESDDDVTPGPADGDPDTFFTLLPAESYPATLEDPTALISSKESASSSASSPEGNSTLAQSKTTPPGLQNLEERSLSKSQQTFLYGYRSRKASN